MALQASCRYGHVLGGPKDTAMGEITCSHSVQFPELSWSSCPQGGAGKGRPAKQGRMSRPGRWFSSSIVPLCPLEADLGAEADCAREEGSGSTY